MKYAQIAEVRWAIQGLSTEYTLTIAYQLAKNLVKCKKVMDEIQDLVTDITKQHAVLDAQGNVTYLDKKMVFKSEEDEKITNELIEKVNQDEFVLELHKVPFSRIEKFVEENGVKGIYLVPLIDVMFVESEEEVKQKPKKEGE